MMSRPRTGYAELGDGKLYYESGGEGDTLVLTHAGFVDSRMWDEQWQDFTQHFEVIRYDMRGYGKSDLAQGPVSRRQDLYHLLTDLGVLRAHFLGCSMGGEATLDFALEHPEMVESLILVSAAPSGFEMRGEPPPELMEMMGAVKQGDLQRASELQLRLWVDGPSRQPEQVDSRVRRRAADMNRIAVNNGTFAVADSQPLNPLNPPAAKRLNEIRVPTLIIAGELDNPEIVRAADVMAAAIPGAKKVIIRDAAHVPNMEKPEEFNRAVLDFLRGQ